MTTIKTTTDLTRELKPFGSQSVVFSVNGTMYSVAEISKETVEEAEKVNIKLEEITE